MPTLPSPVMVKRFRMPAPALVKKFNCLPAVSEAKKKPFTSCPSRPLDATPVNCTWCVVWPMKRMLPFTCSLAIGFVVPMPTLVPLSKICESPMVSVAVNFATMLVVPLPSIRVFGSSMGTSPDSVAESPPAAGDSDNMNADAGLPPSISASAALSAYGTLTSKTRGCSGSPCTCTLSQCASSLLKISKGSPSALAAPSNTV